MAWATAAWETLDAAIAAATEADIEAWEAGSTTALGLTAGVTRGGKRFRSEDPVPQSNVRRRFGPVNVPLPDGSDSSEDSSVSNNTPSTNPPMPDRASTIRGARGHQDEVEVMPHHGPMSKIVEDYHTINLDYYFRDSNFNATPAQFSFSDWQFRLNSIYDVNETDVGQQQPLGRDTWASIYQYYRVLGCTMEVKVVNRQNVHTLLSGIVLEEDNVTLTTSPENFMMRKNAIRRIIPGNNFANPSTSVITYNYTPESWDHHVQESGIEERWTPIGETPSNNHRAILRFIGADGGFGVPSEVDYEFFIHMKFTVQFREANKTILTTGSLPS